MPGKRSPKGPKVDRVSRYQVLCSAEQFSLVHSEQRVAPDSHEFRYTIFLRSVARTQLGICLCLEPSDVFPWRDDENETDSLLERMVKEIKKPRAAAILSRGRAVTKRQVGQFRSLWQICEDQGQEQILLYAQEYGFLYLEIKETDHTPPLEPLRAWVFESFLFDRMFFALQTFRQIKEQGVSDEDFNRVFEGRMKKIWSSSTLELGSLKYKLFMKKILDGRKFDYEVIDWHEMMSQTINYYLRQLCNPYLDIKGDRAVQVEPRNQLGALWKNLIYDYWIPTDNARYCRECGTNISHYPAQARYCKPHQSDAFRKQRQRKKMKGSGGTSR